MIDVQLVPTGKCYDDALEFMEQEAKAQTTLAAARRRLRELTLVHGLLKDPNGKLYSHAWVEEGEICWAIGYWNEEMVAVEVTKEKFYREMCVHEKTSYTATEALHHNKLHNNYGPWEERYLAHCRDVDEEKMRRLKEKVLRHDGESHEPCARA